jgi:hypothetical protein
VSHARPLSWLLYAVGLLGLLALPLLERSISFDENALLAGSARPTVRYAQQLYAALGSLTREV